MIVNKFAKYFSEICSVNSTEKNVNMMLSLKQRFSNYIGDTENISDLIKIDLIEDSFKKLNSSKAVRLDGLSSEHLKFAHAILL